MLICLLSNPDQFLQTPIPADPGLKARELGKKSCIILLSSWIAEIAIKTLLVTDRNDVGSDAVWGHDLLKLHDMLEPKTKVELSDIHSNNLPSPLREWQDGEGILAILNSEHDQFTTWRYLSSKIGIKSDPKKIATVGYAAYMLHVQRTNLPSLPDG